MIDPRPELSKLSDYVPGKSIEEIRAKLLAANREFAKRRLERNVGELSDADLAAADRKFAADCRAFAAGMETHRHFAQSAKMGVLTLPGGSTLDMIWCPPGSFSMGSPESENGRKADETLHDETIGAGFWMAKFELTCRQFAGVTGNASVDAESDLPATGLLNFREFCEKAGLELPTEAEWEYACRAGSAAPFAGTGVPGDMAWFADNAGGKIHRVGLKLPNAWGFHDMHGNVRESCEGSGGPVRGGCVRDGADGGRAASRESSERLTRERLEKDMDTMMRRMREEGIDERDLQTGIEWLPPRKREKMRKLFEEGVIVNPQAVGNAIFRTIGCRPVFREGGGADTK